LLEISLGIAQESPAVSPYLPAIISFFGTMIAAALSGYILLTTSRKSISITRSSHLRTLELETLAHLLSTDNKTMDEENLKALAAKASLIIDKRCKSGSKLFEHLASPNYATIDEFEEWKSELLTLSSDYITEQQR
jgi:hypothetical protein